MTTGLDRVSVVGIEAVGRHGVFDHEKADGQRFLADVVLHVDTRRAAARDDLAAAVDYGVVGEAVHAVLAGPARDLIETVVEEIALRLLGDPRVAAVDVTLHKPQAPLRVPFADVSVAVHRSQADLTVARAPTAPAAVVLALGSNLGDRAATLTSAVAALAELPDVSIRAVSPLMSTDPVGGPEQPDYLNAVALGHSTLSPLGLLHACQDIEAAHGRQRSTRWGPRTLDIDLIAFGDMVVETATLTLPHPRAAGRAFVLAPWLAVDSGAVLPGLLGARRIDRLLADLGGIR